MFGRFRVNGHQTHFQLDSCAFCNVLREKGIDLSHEKLLPTNLRLRVYNGIVIRPLEHINAAVHNPVTRETYHMEFLVVNEASTAILGAKACQEMDLISVHRERFLEDDTEKPASVHDFRENLKTVSKAKFLSRFSNVFNGQLRRFDGQAHFEVSKEAWPVIMPTRWVPLAMQDRLDSELSRLENMGVITK